MADAGKCSDWKAWQDYQPPDPGTVHVTGKCTFPTSGYSVELKHHMPQGINPAILMLDKVVHAPTGPVNQVITTVNVRYSEKRKDRVTEIHILPDDIHLPVEEVH